MSSTEEQIATAPSKPTGYSRWRYIIPLVVLVLFGGFFAAPWIMVALDADTEVPMQLGFPSQWIAPIVAIPLLTLWWLLFAPFRWLTRFVAFFAISFLIAGGLWLGVRKVEITKGRITMAPRLHFVWEPEYAPEKSASPDELPAIFAYIGPDDFPRYRGVHSDGIVGWIKLGTDWDKTPPTVVWSHPCGNGYSGIAVAGNIVVTLEQRPEGESVVCYDRGSGRQRWAHASKEGEFYKDKTLMGDGPRSTPTIHNDHIYTIGGTGELACHHIDGKLVWRTNILDDAKAKNIEWGLTGSPLIVDDLVITNPGIDKEAPGDAAVIAYDKTKGTIRWRTGNRPAGYSSPQLVTLGGVAQILLFDGAGLVSYEPKTGKELWNFPWVPAFPMNSIQPVIFGKDRIFISSEAPHGCAMLRITPPKGDAPWTVDKVWQNKNLLARYANPVTDGKSIFGLHSLQGVLTCLDAETGNVKWKGEREGPGQLLLTPNALILVNGDNGDVALFDPQSATTCNELARRPVFEKEKRDKTWNTPALAGDQLFVRNQAHIVCLKLPDR